MEERLPLVQAMQLRLVTPHLVGRSLQVATNSGDANEANYALGTCVLVYNSTGGDPLANNSVQTVYSLAGYIFVLTSGTALSGTWRCRGYTVGLSSYYYYTFTRVA
jgi:hypothetical protein